MSKIAKAWSVAALATSLHACGVRGGRQHAPEATATQEAFETDAFELDGRSLEAVTLPPAAKMQTGIVPGTGILTGGKLLFRTVQPTATTSSHISVLPIGNAPVHVDAADGLPNLADLTSDTEAQDVALPATAGAKLFRDADAYFMGHSSIQFNPKYGTAPFPVSNHDGCVRGVFATSLAPKTALDCYRLIVFAAVQRGTNKFMQQAEIAVTASHVPPHRINSATYVLPTGGLAAFVPMQPVDYIAPDELRGYEMTATLDSRLVIFQVHSVPTHPVAPVATNHAFIFNPRPWDPSGWTAPRRLTELSTFAAGRSICLSADDRTSAEDAEQRGCPAAQRVPFASYFPLAKNPLRLDDGSVIAPTKSILCAYPWIDPEGANLHCQMLRRSAYAVVGRSTGWTFKLVDGYFNRQRSYEDCAQHGTLCTGPTITQSLGATGSAWPVSEDIVRLDGEPALPITQDLHAQSIIARDKGNTAIYGEVSFSDMLDGNYLLYLHMNESVRHCWPAYCLDRYDQPIGFTYDVNTTPDTAGTFSSGVFSGNAGFLQKMYPNLAPTGAENAEVMVADSGFNGRAAYFADNGRLTVTPRSVNGEVPALNAPIPRMNIMFALKVLADPKNTVNPSDENYRTIAEKPGSWLVALLANRRLVVRTWVNGVMYSVLTDAIDVSSTPVGRDWTHIAINYLGINEAAGLHHTRLVVYLHDAAGKAHISYVDVPVDAPIDGTNYPLVLGAFVRNGQTTWRPIPGPAVVAIDEFSISRLSRTNNEIAVASHVKTSADAVRVPDSQRGPLPIGLDAREARLPKTVANLFGDQTIIQLGQDLFADVNLSLGADGKAQGVACKTCHQSERAFTDGKVVAHGVADGTRNTPTILNRLFSIKQFSDGRAGDLDLQALGPITNPLEMNAAMPKVLEYLRAVSSGYPAKFQKAFGTPGKLPDEAQLAAALTVFQLSLVSGGSDVDVINQGGVPAGLTGPEIAAILRGQQVFRGSGRCAGCHSSSNYSDELFHNTGTAFSASRHTYLDRGRAAVSGSLADSGAFKTPTLRNLCLTAPYMHDGHVATLAEAISFYNKGGELAAGDPHVDAQLQPLGLSPADEANLLKFLVHLSPRGSQAACR